MSRPAVTSRDDLADALIRVVAGHGLDAVSIRAVAREAGVSIGTVQYYFATKDELLLAAYRRVIDQVTARARRVAEQDPSPRDYIRSLVRELLPLDERREAELRVAVAFTARSVYSPRLTELYTDGYGALVAAIANALRRAAERDETAPDVIPQRDATQAVALADGLGWHLLCAQGELASDAAEAALDAYLARLLP
jgi:AcrR family transcriptional regulator